MQEAKVTVVIPNYNGIKYIRDCMDSLRRQNYEPFEVLVIDNASKDGSLEILMQEYPEARVIALEENTGFCYAVNLGIRESKTPYVILLNNDTIVKPDFVSALVKTIEEGKDIFSVSAQMLSMEDENLLDGAGDGVSLGLSGGNDLIGLGLGGGQHIVSLGLAVGFDLTGHLLGGDQGQLHGLFVRAVFLDLFHEDLHLALQNGGFLLGSGQIVGQFIQKIVYFAHGVAAEGGFLKSFFANVLSGNHKRTPYLSII